MSDFSHKTMNTETMYFITYTIIFICASVISKMLKYAFMGKIENSKDDVPHTSFGVKSGI